MNPTDTPASPAAVRELTAEDFDEAVSEGLHVIDLCGRSPRWP